MCRKNKVSDIDTGCTILVDGAPQKLLAEITINPRAIQRKDTDQSVPVVSTATQLFCNPLSPHGQWPLHSARVVVFKTDKNIVLLNVDINDERNFCSSDSGVGHLQASFEQSSKKKIKSAIDDEEDEALNAVA